MVKKDTSFFPAEKLPKRLSLFSNVFYIAIPDFKILISFRKAKNRNLNIRSHRIQYSKILKSPTSDAILYSMTSLRIKLITIH